MSKPQKIKIGQVGFGAVNGYPPTHWRLDGKTASGSWRLAHVKHPRQSTAYPDQFVAWTDVERIMA